MLQHMASLGPFSLEASKEMYPESCHTQIAMPNTLYIQMIYMLLPFFFWSVASEM